MTTPLPNARNADGEASDLAPVGVAWYGRLYRDSCDEGFVMRSDRTGAAKAFTLIAERVSSEGEVLQWLFESSDGIRVIVFND